MGAVAGCTLQFFVPESRRIHGRAAHDWLLETARGMGIAGGTAFRGIAGYGRHGVFHEEHFFELAGDLPVQVLFALTEAEADRLLERLDQEGVAVVYTRQSAHFGVTGDP